MKTLACLLTSLALAAPGHADEMPTDHSVDAANIRYGRVYELAKHVCPPVVEELLDEVVNSRTTRRTIELLNQAAGEAQLNHDEQSLLYLMCDMYNRGAGNMHTPAK